jgi:hypothetical protein
MTDVQEEASVGTTRQKWSEGPRQWTATISEEIRPQEASIGKPGNLNVTLTTRREIARRIISSTVTQIMNIWTLWRDRPPPKRKKGPHTEQEPVM